MAEPIASRGGPWCPTRRPAKLSVARREPHSAWADASAKKGAHGGNMVSPVIKRRGRTGKHGFPREKLGRSGQALLCARARDDPVAVAEAGPRSRLAMLVPELGDLLLELLELGRDRRIAPLAKALPELATPLGGWLDRRAVLLNSPHATVNAETIAGMPGRLGPD